MGFMRWHRKHFIFTSYLWALPFIAVTCAHMDPALTPCIAELQGTQCTPMPLFSNSAPTLLSSSGLPFPPSRFSHTALSTQRPAPRFSHSSATKPTSEKRRTILQTTQTPLRIPDEVHPLGKQTQGADSSYLLLTSGFS